MNEKDEIGNLQSNNVSWPRLILVVVLTWLVLSFFFRLYTPNQLTLSYTAFKNAVKQGKISEITLDGQQINGKFKKPVTADVKIPSKTEKGKDTAVYEIFQTVKPTFDNRDLMRLLESITM